MPEQENIELSELWYNKGVKFSKLSGSRIHHFFHGYNLQRWFNASLLKSVVQLSNQERFF